MSFPFTLSGVPLGLLCPASTQTEGAVSVSGESNHSRRGDAAHDEIAKMFNAGGAPVPTGPWSKLALEAVSGFVSDVSAYAWSAELALAYMPDTKTTMVLGSDIGREYEKFGAPSGSIPGTIDLVGFNTEKKHAVIVEWGTGFDIFHKRHQLMAQAAAYTHAVRWAPEDGWTLDLALVRLSEASYEEVWLESLSWAKARELSYMFDEILATRQLPPTPGDHCTKLYCPRSASCPLMQPAMSMTATAASMADIHAPITLDNAAAFRRGIQLAKRWLDTKKDELDELARRETIVLENGKRYMPVLSERSSLSTTALLELAKQKGASEEEIAACTKTTAFESFREVNMSPRPTRKKKEAA